MQLLMQKQSACSRNKIQNAFHSFSISQMIKNISDSIMLRVDKCSRTIQIFSPFYGQRLVQRWKDRFKLETTMALRIQARVRGIYGREFARRIQY